MSSLVLRWDTSRKVWIAREDSRVDVLTDGAMLDRLQQYRSRMDEVHLKGLGARLRYLKQELGKKYRWEEGKGIVEVPD